MSSSERMKTAMYTTYKGYTSTPTRTPTYTHRVHVFTWYVCASGVCRLDGSLGRYHPCRGTCKYEKLGGKREIAFTLIPLSNRLSINNSFCLISVVLAGFCLWYQPVHYVYLHHLLTDAVPAKPIYLSNSESPVGRSACLHAVPHGDGPLARAWVFSY